MNTTVISIFLNSSTLYQLNWLLGNAHIGNIFFIGVKLLKAKSSLCFVFVCTTEIALNQI